MQGGRCFEDLVGWDFLPSAYSSLHNLRHLTLGTAAAYSIYPGELITSIEQVLLHDTCVHLQQLLQ